MSPGWKAGHAVHWSTVCTPTCCLLCRGRKCCSSVGVQEATVRPAAVKKKVPWLRERGSYAGRRNEVCEVLKKCYFLTQSPCCSGWSRCHLTNAGGEPHMGHVSACLHQQPASGWVSGRLCPWSQGPTTHHSSSGSPRGQCDGHSLSGSWNRNGGIRSHF